MGLMLIIVGQERAMGICIPWKQFSFSFRSRWNVLDIERTDEHGNVSYISDYFSCHIKDIYLISPRSKTYTTAFTRVGVPINDIYLVPEISNDQSWTATTRVPPLCSVSRT